MSYNIIGGEGSCQVVDGCWLLTVGAVEGWDSYGNFLKKDNDKVCYTN